MHCVIIGFSNINDSSEKRLYNAENNSYKTAENISPYLVNSPNIFITERRQPICDVPEMMSGNKPTDDGNFILIEKEKAEFLEKEQQAVKFIRLYMMGKDFIRKSYSAVYGLFSFA